MFPAYAWVSGSLKIWSFLDLCLCPAPSDGTCVAVPVELPCQRPEAGFTALTSIPTWAQHRAWSQTATEQSLDALCSWRSFIQETPDSCLMKFKMVLNLIWKLKFYMNPDSQCFEHMPKRQLSPSDCSPRVGSAEFPNPQGEYFSFQK